MKPPHPSLVMALLLAVCFALATFLVPHTAQWSGKSDGSPLKVALGDARKLFADHFYNKADAYFHSGFYPTMFEQAQRTTAANHMAEHHDHEGSAKEEEEEAKAADFMGKPRDWIDRFGRHFYPSTHSHLDKQGEAKEILPWLRISAELDPQRIETYTVGAYYLRSNMKEPHEAETFLREGLRENPNSYEILFELGKIYAEDWHETNHARNLWEIALNRWQGQEAQGKNPDAVKKGDEIVANLAHVEEEEGNLKKALSYLELEVTLSPAPEGVRKRIEELKAKVGGGPAK
jgi:tetratricopeptide (TPR) repeat protein